MERPAASSACGTRCDIGAAAKRAERQAIVGRFSGELRLDPAGQHHDAGAACDAATGCAENR